MEAGDGALAAAIRAVAAQQKQGLEAGPKALLAAVQASDSRFATLGIQKFKKTLTRVKAEQKDAAAPDSTAVQAPAAPPASAPPKTTSTAIAKGTAQDCKAGHGLTRFFTYRGDFSCGLCRGKMPQGAPMWGCRVCDWNVCERQCHPSVAQITLDTLRDEIECLEAKVAKLSDGSTALNRSLLAQVEAEVHAFERRLDGSTAKVLAQAAPVPMDEALARVEKKALLARSEALFTRIEATFTELAAAATAASASPAELTAAPSAS
jgi:hypothetical protein